jgi:hypothetical protein
MSYAEFVEWQAYYTISPFGPDRDDLRIAIHGMRTSNIHLGKKGFKLNDFLPNFEPRKPMSAAEMERRFKAQMRVNMGMAVNG